MKLLCCAPAAILADEMYRHSLAASMDRDWPYPGAAQGWEKEGCENYTSPQIWANEQPPQQSARRKASGGYLLRSSPASGKDHSIRTGVWREGFHHHDSLNHCPLHLPTDSRNIRPQPQNSKTTASCLVTTWRSRSRTQHVTRVRRGGLWSQISSSWSEME